MTQSADDVFDHFELFRGPEYKEMFTNKRNKFEAARRCRSPARARMDEDAGIPGEELRARSPDHQPGEGLPAARRRVRGRRLRGYAALRAWHAGLRRLLPQPFLAPFQGADLGGLLVDDRGRGGVRRPQQHDRRARQQLQSVQAQDDRGLDHLHGGSDRRRPQRLHQDGEGKGLGAGGIRRALRAHAGLRRQPRHRLRQHA